MTLIVYVWFLSLPCLSNFKIHYFISVRQRVNYNILFMFFFNSFAYINEVVKLAEDFRYFFRGL